MTNEGKGPQHTHLLLVDSQLHEVDSAHAAIYGINGQVTLYLMYAKTLAHFNISEIERHLNSHCWPRWDLHLPLSLPVFQKNCQPEILFKINSLLKGLCVTLITGMCSANLLTAAYVLKHISFCSCPMLIHADCLTYLFSVANLFIYPQIECVVLSIPALCWRAPI